MITRYIQGSRVEAGVVVAVLIVAILLVMLAASPFFPFLGNPVLLGLAAAIVALSVRGIRARRT